MENKFDRIKSDYLTILESVKGLQTLPEDSFFYSLPVSQVAHYTHLAEACKIIYQWNLKPTTKFVTGRLGEQHLKQHCLRSRLGDLQDFNVVWFSVMFEWSKDALKEMKEKLTTEVTSYLEAQSIIGTGVEYDVARCFKAPLFQGSRYGPYAFSCSWGSLLEQCSSLWKQHNFSEVPQYHVLGTFEYPIERMHALLVCSKDDPRFSKFPLLKDDPVLKETADGWEWHLRSTTDNGQQHEVLAFAIAVPEDIPPCIPNLPLGGKCSEGDDAPMEEWLRNAFDEYSSSSKCIVFSEPFFKGERTVLTETDKRLNMLHTVKSVKIVHARVELFGSWYAKGTEIKPVYTSTGSVEIPYCNFTLQSIYFE